MRLFKTAEGLEVRLCTATGNISVDGPEACQPVRGGFVCDEPVRSYVEDCCVKSCRVMGGRIASRLQIKTMCSMVLASLNRIIVVHNLHHPQG